MKVEPSRQQALLAGHGHVWPPRGFSGVGFVTRIGASEPLPGFGGETGHVWDREPLATPCGLGEVSPTAADTEKDAGTCPCCLVLVASWGRSSLLGVTSCPTSGDWGARGRWQTWCGLLCLPGV